MIPPAMIPPLIDLVITKILRPGKQQQAAKSLAKKLLADQTQLGALEKSINQTLAKTDQGQIEINRIEAASDKFWKAGWRPAAGWICIIALGWHYLFEPILATLLALFGIKMTPLPRADFNDLWTLLFALLGLSGLRSIDKQKDKK